MLSVLKEERDDVEMVTQLLPYHVYSNVFTVSFCTKGSRS